MSEKECLTQLISLIEHFNNGGLDFNATDIVAIKYLISKNQKYKEVIDKIKEYITIYRSYEDIDGKDYLKGRYEIGTLSLSQVDKLLDILKEVE